MKQRKYVYTLLNKITTSSGIPTVNIMLNIQESTFVLRVQSNMVIQSISKTFNTLTYFSMYVFVCVYIYI